MLGWIAGTKGMNRLSLLFTSRRRYGTPWCPTVKGGGGGGVGRDGVDSDGGDGRVRGAQLPDLCLSGMIVGASFAEPTNCALRACVRSVGLLPRYFDAQQLPVITEIICCRRDVGWILLSPIPKLPTPLARAPVFLCAGVCACAHLLKTLFFLRKLNPRTIKTTTTTRSRYFLACHHLLPSKPFRHLNTTPRDDDDD